MNRPPVNDPGSDVGASLALQRLEESVWVVQAQSGDREAFAHLMTRHERQVFYYLRRFIDSPEEALDANQELWVEVFRGLPGLRVPAAFRVWLYRLAHGRVVRFFRRTSSVDAFTEPLGDAHAELPEEPGTLVDAEAVHHSLGQLPLILRSVLTLHYLRDLSLEEIAEATGVPLGTVKSRLHHARVALRKQMERNADEIP